MPHKLRTKLKEDEFYCVACNKRCKANSEDICVVVFKNGVPALQGECSKCDCDVYKFIKWNSEDRLSEKYGRC